MINLTCVFLWAFGFVVGFFASIPVEAKPPSKPAEDGFIVADRAVIDEVRLGNSFGTPSYTHPSRTPPPF